MNKIYSYMYMADFCCEVLNTKIEILLHHLQPLTNYSSYECSALHYLMPFILNFDQLLCLESGQYRKWSMNKVILYLLLPTACIPCECSRLQYLLSHVLNLQPLLSASYSTWNVSLLLSSDWLAVRSTPATM